ncbi:tetraprenyl-beta-curcumene synthase [Paenibacillus selenitireducens]|uniref:Tetraprenyl-beta-curcumene synthase n=2 Tax=Paenibacillus selenitireducens TaxID=1324314 RepID=A0A1T2XNV8_9BACL|nr:tetraprenyl-beta-curcumene synthase family protein [Paenibacillus selenitireducens]OPA81518.1 tetraprenyl-beta-curcumene synthase [Paenibacillus selenitireducens]
MQHRPISAPLNPIKLMYRVYNYILPGVSDALGHWKRQAESITDEELRKQALASIATKQFHCQGGAVYAAIDLSQRDVLIPLIVAFQTISDYLDNLCDRSTSMDPVDFRQLHQSMLDAIDPEAPLRNYYQYHPEHEDDGYLHELVSTCQSCIKQLPSYLIVMPFVEELVGLYVDLQVYKHIRHELREPELTAWWEENRNKSPHLYWNEFAAATGSTLGMFMLFAAASKPNLDRSEAISIREAYFPHVCGLHILLDYLIDQEEDRQGGDLNFCNYYEEQEMLCQRILMVVEGARKDVRTLPHAKFHSMVIEGLIALYLSDPKVADQQQVKSVSKRLMRKSPMTRLFFWANSLWIRKHKS